MLLLEFKPILFVLAFLFVITGFNPARRFERVPRLRD